MYYQMCTRTCLGVKRSFNSFLRMIFVFEQLFFSTTHFSAVHPYIIFVQYVHSFYRWIYCWVFFYFLLKVNLPLCFYFSLRFRISKTFETVRVKIKYWNGELSIEGKLLFLHVYTQTRTHTPLAHFGKSRHNICAQFTVLLGSLFILGTITSFFFFKSIIPKTTANLMYNIIDNQLFLQPPLIHHKEPNTGLSTTTSV